jgi:tRNA pseudouridine38-40 synthase
MASRYKLTLEYDGHNFSGWQRQPDSRTVQQEIEKAFGIFYQKRVEVHGQGRTDAGVHASGQVAHADLPDHPPADRLLSAMNGLLPDDIALLSLEPASDSFHARFDARSRLYHYRICMKPSPLARHRSWVYHRPLDFDLLNRLADQVSDSADFANFAKLDSNSGKSTICSIIESSWLVDQPDRQLIYVIKANRFLRHMVRRLTGSMILAASGQLEPGLFEAMLNEVPLPAGVGKGHSAPAHGLTLIRVDYDDPGEENESTNSN